MTADDLPGENGYGGIIHDKPVIAKDEVFYEGDPVALVAAEDLKTAEKAVSLIEVEYEPLESYDSPADMLREDAPVLHREYPIPRKGKHFRRGAHPQGRRENGVRGRGRRCGQLV